MAKSKKCGVIKLLINGRLISRRDYTDAAYRKRIVKDWEKMYAIGKFTHSLRKIEIIIAPNDMLEKTNSWGRSTFIYGLTGIRQKYADFSD